MSGRGKYIRTTETLLKLSQSHLGQVHTDEYKERMRLINLGSQNPFFNKSHSVEVRSFLAQRENSIFYGEQNPNYRGGASNEPWPLEFNETLKEQIRERDNYLCQLCGIPQCECTRKLAVHHVDYNKLNCIPENLLSLCTRCNSKVNFNREYWMNYFIVRMNL
jgi:hypothetical protein